MDPIITPIVIVLGKYAIGKGVELAKEVGPKAVEKAKELFVLAIDRLRHDKRDVIVAEFEKDPKTYQKPVEKTLDEAAQADPAFLAQLQALFEQYEHEVTVYRATLTGSGAIAQGPGAVAAGAGGVAVGGSVQGSTIVTGSHNIVGSGNQVGGIRANRIEAENVVEGAQMIGGDAQTAAGLVDLAKAIQRGGITADEIKAKNLVSGLQYIADPTTATPDDLRREVAALRGRLDKAIVQGEIADKGDAEDAQDALKKAESVLAGPQPQGSRVARKLGEVTDILIRAADAAKAAGRVGMEIIKLAPIAATLKQVAERLFGG